MDIYAYKSSNKLKKIVSQLKDINVSTEYNMLLNSELYEKTNKIEFDENKKPFLMQEKYIYVPSYGFNGKEKETSILQEHEIGTKEYFLSVGEPEKQYKRVLIKNFE